MSVAPIVLSAAWALIAVQSVRFMRDGRALLFGCVAIGLAALAAAAALAGLEMVALVCLGAACVLFGLCFAPWTLSNELMAWGVGFVVAACGAYAIISGIAPLIALLCIFPLAFDAASTLVHKRLHQTEARPLYQIGIDAKLGAKSVAAAYWLMSAHCGLVAVIASAVQRGAQGAAPQSSTLTALTKIASFTPQIAVILLGLIAWKTARAIRLYSAGHQAASAEEG